MYKRWSNISNISPHREFSSRVKKGTSSQPSLGPAFMQLWKLHSTSVQSLFSFSLLPNLGAEEREDPLLP